jgi:hypothetical protein
MSAAPIPFESLSGALAPRNPDEPNDQLQQERAEERLNAPRLEKFLNRCLDSIASLDQTDNLNIHNEMVRAAAYYDGRWDGEVRNGTWFDNRKIPGEIAPKDNDIKKHVDKLNMEMCRSRIEYAVEAVDKSNAAKREAAEFATRRIKVNQSRIETEPFIQAENQSLLLKTWTLRYTFFDQDAESQEKSTELRVTANLTDAQSVTVCRTCGMSGVPDQPCGFCGDTGTKNIVSSPGQRLETQGGKKSAGRVVTIRPDATMVQLDLNARDIPSSSFLRWRLVMRRCDWEAMYPNTRIPSSEESDEARHRAEAQGALGWRGTTNESGEDQFEKIEGELVWLDPRVYQRYVNKENETLGGGELFPANAKLADVFPHGVCVARVGNKILDLTPSNKNTRWTMCVYGIREHALHGSGIFSLLGIQDILNELNAQILANQVYNSVGRDLVRSGVIEGGQLPALDQVAYVTAPETVGDIARWAAGKLAPSPMSPEVYAYREAMRGSMQDAAGTSSLSTQGAADMKVLGTATGVEASRDQAVGRMIPNRKLQAHMGVEWARQVLELERENYDESVFADYAGKADERGSVEFTQRGVATFFEMDVATEFIIMPVEGSWTPSTPMQEKANASEFGQIAAQLSRAPHADQILSIIAPKYGQDFSVDEFGAAQRSASIRLEEYAKVAKAVMESGAPATPEVAAIVLQNCAEWAQVDPEMDNHQGFGNYYRDWFTSDEGRNANQLLRMVIRSVYQLHQQGNVEQQQQAVEDEIQATLPAKVAASVESDVTHSQELEHQEEAEDARDEREMAKMALLGGEPQAHPTAE